VEMAEMAKKMSRDGFGAWEICPQFVKMDENGENEVSHLTLGVLIFKQGRMLMCFANPCKGSMQHESNSNTCTNQGLTIYDPMVSGK
jgi:hypothetical protein